MEGETELLDLKTVSVPKESLYKSKITLDNYKQKHVCILSNSDCSDLYYKVGPDTKQCVIKDCGALRDFSGLEDAANLEILSVAGAHKLVSINPLK